MRIVLLGAGGQLGTALSARFAGKVIPLGTDAIDIADANQVRRIVPELHPELVINAAAYNFVDRAEDEFDRVYAINIKSIFHMTNAVVPVMRKQGGGSIINIGSTAGVRPRPGLTWYNGSKGAVNLVSKSMAVELAPDKIRVNCVAPVIGETALLESFMGVPDTPEK